MCESLVFITQILIDNTEKAIGRAWQENLHHQQTELMVKRIITLRMLSVILLKDLNS